MIRKNIYFKEIQRGVYIAKKTTAEKFSTSTSHAEFGSVGVRRRQLFSEIGLQNLNLQSDMTFFGGL